MVNITHPVIPLKIKGNKEEKRNRGIYFGLAVF